MLDQLLRDIRDEAEQSEILTSEAQQALTKDLKHALAQLNQKHTFEPGDLVKFKSGLRNKKDFRGGVGVVMEVLETPIIATTDNSGSTYFREPLDIVVGEISNKGVLIGFHYDSRRLEPYVESGSAD